jgi:hypothetical protein
MAGYWMGEAFLGDCLFKPFANRWSRPTLKNDKN